MDSSVFGILDVIFVGARHLCAVWLVPDAERTKGEISTSIRSIVVVRISEEPEKNVRIWMAYKAYIAPKMLIFWDLLSPVVYGAVGLGSMQMCMRCRWPVYALQ